MSFVDEIKRRNVAKVAVLYLIAAWLILQVAELLFDAIGVPEEFLRFIIAVVILGFPLVLIFSWVYEVTPEGIKREKEIDRSQSITAETGQRINRMIVVLLVLTIAVVALDRLVPESAEPTDTVVAAKGATSEGDAATDAVEITETRPAQSIAVLPFSDLSPEGDQEFFSEGIAEEILNVLVRIEGLQVASRTSAWGFKGQEALGIPAIAQSLNVAHVLEGSVRKSGDTVRVTAQLIDARSDTHLWSDTFDRDLTAENVFAIQDEIAAAIVEQLGVIIDTDADGAPTISRSADTQHISAYELYLQASQMFVLRERLNTAIDLFQQAVSIDPGFARAWAGLAAVANVAPEWYYTGHDYPALAVESAERAVELNPDLALPYAVLADQASSSSRPDYGRALELYDEALRRDPRETTALLWRAIVYMAVGYFDLAERDLVACLNVDPAYHNCRAHQAGNAFYRGDFGRTIELFEENFRNGFIGNNTLVYLSFVARGETAPVLAAISHWNNANNTPRAANFEFRALVDPDFDYEAERLQIEASYIPKGGGNPIWHDGVDDYNFLYRRYDVLSTDYYPFWWFPHPVEFRESPHPRRLIILMGLPEFWREHGFPDRCRPVGDDDFECD